MNILVENSGYRLLNLGDIAMLQAAVRRLQSMWPDAHIYVITADPVRLERFCPGTYPISDQHIHFFTGTYQSLSCLPRHIVSHARPLETLVRTLLPKFSAKIIQKKFNKFGYKKEDVSRVVEIITSADLVVGTGGGYLTDAFPGMVDGVLGTFRMAQQHGRPTMLLGQGIGPLHNTRLQDMAKKILPRVEFFSLREGVTGPPLLDILGVDRNRVMVTGDDAIELAYGRRNPELGSGIGINLRMANYSDVNNAVTEMVRQSVQRAAQCYSVPLISLPIAFAAAESDTTTIRKIGEGYKLFTEAEQYQFPEQVIDQVGKCRVVVTGSYHAGVFALSQGIPVVGLVKSEYYKDKFVGLANQFGAGCDVITLDSQDAEQQIFDAIVHAWNGAEHLRPDLLFAAQKQIAEGHKAYARVKRIL